MLSSSGAEPYGSCQTRTAKLLLLSACHEAKHVKTVFKSVKRKHLTVTIGTLKMRCYLYRTLIIRSKCQNKNIYSFPQNKTTRPLWQNNGKHLKLVKHWYCTADNTVINNKIDYTDRYNNVLLSIDVIIHVIRA